MVTGQAATYQAEVAVNSPGTTQLGNLTGTVSLYAQDTQGDPRIALCSTDVGVSGATVSCSSSAAVAGGSPWAITAVYSGDTNFAASTSAPFGQTVNPAATSTVISATASPSVTGQTITATAGFTITAPGSDTPVAPTGTVEFEISLNGGTSFSPISGCVTQAATWNGTTHAGTASCTLPSPPAVSSVELKAVYSGDPNFVTSTSSPFTLVVNEASTSTVIGVDTNPSVSGETVNYTATVAVTPPGSDSTPPTGTVDFQSSTNDGDTWNDIAGCSTQGLVWDPETHTGTSGCATAFAETSSGSEVRAVYSGDGNFDGSISATPVTQVVNAASTTTSVVLVPDTTVSGQTVTATATVLITAPGSDIPSAPTGTVDFQYSTNDGDSWSDISGCSIQDLSWDSDGHTGTSACTTSFDAGSSPVEVQAIYSGDANFNLSTSPSADETVTQADTTTSVIATPDTSVSGQTVSFSATVLITAPGSDSPAAPTGTVDFQYSTNDGDTWTDISGCSTQDLVWDSDGHTGTSLCSTAFAATSSGVEVQAVYSGDGNFTTSTSAAVTRTVNPAATSTVVSATASPSVTGQTITATAGFTITAPGSDTPVAPTGTVEFEISLNGGTSFSPISGCETQATSWDITTHAGTSVCTLPSPPAVSSVELKAVYSGDPNFVTSTSPPFTQVVNEASTSTVIGVDTNPSVSGETVNYTASVTVTPPGTDNTPPTGTVDFQSSTNDGDTWNDISGCSTQGLSWNSETHTGTSGCATAFAETSSGSEVRAVYSGDGNFEGSISATPVTQVVNAASTTTSVVLTPTTTVSGQTVTATATVLVTSPGSDSPAAPTGTVDFQYSTNGGDSWSDVSGCGGQDLSWDSDGHTGTSACTTSFDAGSSPVEVQAVYSGDANFNLSTSPSADETVDQAATTTSVIATPDTSVSGQTVTATATVLITAPGSDSPSAPTGTVDFQYSTNDGDTWTDISACSTQDLVWDSDGHTGTSVCSTAFAATSSGVEIQAVYSGDGNFDGSISVTPVTQTVNLASTASSVSATASPSVTGQTITATAGFTITAPGSDTPVAPTGTVEFEISLNGGTSFSPISGCVTQAATWNGTTHAGTASCTLPSPPAVSSVELKAVYSGDPNFVTSTSSPFTLVVNEASTSTVIGVDTNPSVSGETVNYTATVAVTPPGSDSTPPTGTVDFQSSTNDGDTWNDIAGCSTQGLVWDPETHTGTSGCATAFAETSSGSEVRAVYSGDGNFDGSISATPVTQVVNAASTTTSVVLVPDTTVSGQTVTATATVLITAPGSDIPSAPTGTVDFQYSTNDGDSWSDISGCSIQDLSWDSDGHTGTSACTTSFDAGSSPVEVQAIYSGDANFNLSTSPSADETVTQADTTTSVIATPDTSVSGQTVSFSATVLITAPGSDSPAAPTGTVDFQYSTNDGDTWTDISGCSTQGLSWNSETHTGTSGCATAFAETSSGSEVRAVYSGDGNFEGSISATPVTQVVNAASTTTSVVLTPTTTVSGQTVTATATVLVTSPGSDSPAAPTGTVDFQYSTNGGDSWSDVSGCGGQDLSWDSDGHTGTSACTTSFDAGSSPVEVQAVYSGDANFNLSTSPSADETVNQAATTTSVIATPDTSVSGQTVTATATVLITAPGSDSPSAPTGTVDFQYSTNDGDTWTDISACSTQDLVWDSDGHTGTSVCSTAFAATSSGVEIQAVYSGDGNFDGSISVTPVTQTVNLASTASSVSATASPSVTGQTITATAGFTITAPGSDTPVAPTGTVEFEISLNGGTSFSPISGCVTQAATWNGTTHAGTASCTLPSPPAVSSVELKAVYSGDPNFVTSTSSPFTLVVNEASTSTVIGVDTNPSVSGETVNYTATVAVTPPGSDSTPPTGTVDFQSSTNDGDTWNDIAGCSTQGLVWDPETHTGTSGCATAFAETSSGSEVRAVYSGDGNFDGSISATPVTQVVNAASTDTGVSAVLNPSVTGQTITVTAGLTIASPGSDSPVAPTGTVEFEISVNGGTSFNPVSGCVTQAMSWNNTAHAGTAVCTLPSPPAVSSVELKAIYSGDFNFSLSTAPPVTQIVNQASTSTAIGVDTNPSVSGETVNYTATVTVTPPGTDNTPPTGTVDFQYSTNGGDTWSNLTGCASRELNWSSEFHAGTSTCAATFAATSSGVKVRSLYSGDGNFDGSTSTVPVAQIVNKAQTADSVALAPTSSVSGQGITATATLLITAPGSDSPAGPTGTVDFRYSTNDGEDWSNVASCTAQVLSWNSESHTGTSACTTDFDAGSSPVEIQAVYSGDVNFTLSTSPSAIETIHQAATTTSVVATPDSSVSGQAVALSAGVLVTAPGTDSPAGPSGTVDFQYSINDGDTWNDVSGCVTEHLSWDSTTHTGGAACTTAFAETSSVVEIHAVYSGDANFTTSTSSNATETVNPAATTTAIGTSSNPSVNGQTVAVAATVTVDSPGGDGPSSPNGTVRFESSTDGGSTWQVIAACLAETLVWSDSAHDGSAQCSVVLGVVQSGIEYRAGYSGDPNFGPSVSDSVTQRVGKSLSSTVLTSTPDSSGPLQPVTFTAKVSVVAPGVASPTGTVTFTDGASTLCAGRVLDGSDSASCTSRIPITATQAIVANYSGNSELASSSGSMDQNVRHGYWLLGADGGVFSFGDAQFYGSLPQIGYAPAGSGRPHELNAPLVGISSTLDGKGYWLVASDGGVFTFGDAQFYGSTGAIHLNKPVVAMAVTPDGKGYWLVASDGGVFAFGDARYHGSTGAIHLNKPIVAMAVTPDGKGYWLVASDGGVFAFGSARYIGSPSSGAMPGAVVGLTPTFDGGGYWIATAGGHVYSYGDATPSNGDPSLSSPVVAIAGTADGKGYWMVTSRGAIYTYGDALYAGSTSGMTLVRPIVGMSGL